MTTPLVALCLGHSRIVLGHIESGAIACDAQTSEWEYHADLAPLIVAELKAHGVTSFVIYRYDGGSYGAAQRWLAARLKAEGSTLALELHFNDSDSPQSNGHEWLYWQTSKNGKRLAECLSASMVSALPSIRPRGAKPLGPADRGAEFVKGTHCPAVICEPFFGSNAKDFQTAIDDMPQLAAAIASGIVHYLKCD
jgi:N-acetylmuramoyl-L-alanine amidase